MGLSRFICLVIYLGFAGFSLSGCLTVTRGTTEKLNVISNPPGASVKAELLLQNGLPAPNNKHRSSGLSCTPTPCSVDLPRNNHARISVSKDGYHPIKFLAVSKGSSPTSTIRPGTIVAGTPAGSHVIAGSSGSFTRIVSGNTMAAIQMLTSYGAGTVIDKATGANRSFSPNPVAVELAPVETAATP